MKWNEQENKGRVKALIGMKELIPNGFQPEISEDLGKKIIISSENDLKKVLQNFV